ncbi:MAG: hypothetical protein HY323_18360 [Betaproteobacteria bacterium]|nr:hypothetical protein [Betaproteobacteria bacterium]
MSEPPLKPDAPFYTEEELDAMYERDPVRALRTSREQLLKNRFPSITGVRNTF